MTTQEMQKAIEQLKSEGHDEQTILGAFYRMFQDDKLTIDELDGIVNLMGYHLTDEFKAMTPEDQKTKGYEETGEDGEDVKQAEEESGKELSDDGKEVVSEDDDDKKDDDDSDESEEEKKAMNLFGQK